MKEEKSFLVDEECLSELFSSGSWFMFPRNFLLVMTEAEAIFLSYLINHHRKVKKEDDDGWFYCKKETVTKEIFFKPNRIQLLVKNLEDRGYISTKWKGQPGLRYFKVNIVKVFKEMRTAVPEKRKMLIDLGFVKP